MGEEGLESERVEKFLPSTVLRVLLVEVDDSTRQIIAALLRKCNYKVSAVSDGLKAWQILKGKQHNIDLVLTEVELPYISGFKLLTLIMEHDVCKNIPVIMMSSHHSISMVLKCTLKGAADFLIKPVRKNELRNLWQHVWRRQTLTGGYIPPNLTATQQKVEAGTDDNTGSNHLSDYAVSSCIERDSSGKGNDAQVHAQPKCKTASYLSNNDMEKQEESAKTPQGSTIQESETEENPSNFGSNVDGPYNGPYKSIALKLGEEHDCGKATNHYESMGSESTENGNIESEGSGNIRESDEPMSGAIDFIGTFDNRSMCSHVHSSSTNGSSSKFECMELPLRRFYKTDERSTLDLSNASTISWYNNSGKTLHSFFPTVADTCIELEESTDRIQDFLSSDHSEDTNSNSQKGVTMGNNKENTTILNDCAKSEFWSAFSPKPAFQQEKSPSLDANTKVNNLKQYQRSDEIWNNCDNLIVKEEKSSEARDDVTGQSCSGSSSLCNDAATQFSSNGYGSISTRSDGVTATAIENSNDGGFRGFHSSEREAALMKFRLKRKDRCYDKKVRYQSRKRLAEQRPRVKGQFVRQVQTAIAGVGVGVGVGADA